MSNAALKLLCARLEVCPISPKQLEECVDLFGLLHGFYSVYIARLLIFSFFYILGTISYSYAVSELTLLHKRSAFFV